MKKYIKCSLNSNLMNISISSSNGGNRQDLAYDLEMLLVRVPVRRYMLALGNRGYCTAYLKLDRNTFKWLYNGESKKVGSYWETRDTYIILPEELKPSTKIQYEDDIVKVWELGDSNILIYDGVEDYDPIKKEDWKFCSELGIYYITDYAKHKTYIKMKVTK